MRLQMVDVLKVQTERASFSKGQFVRFTRGANKGDLAQVRSAAWHMILLKCT